MSETEDVVIIGAGVSGLTLAYALAQSSRHFRVVLLEPRTLQPNMRQWVIPTYPRHILSRFESGRLTEFEVETSSGHVLRRALDRMIIARIAAIDIQNAALDAISSAPTITLIDTARIDEINPARNHVVCETSAGRFKSSWLVDTRPNPDPGLPAGVGVQLSDIVIADNIEGSQPRFRFGCGQDDRVWLSQVAVTPTHVMVETARFCIAGSEQDDIPYSIEKSLNDHGAGGDWNVRTRAVWPLEAGRTQKSAGRIIHAPADAYGFRFAPSMAALRLAEWARNQTVRLSYGLNLTPPPGPGLMARISARRIEAMVRKDPRLAAAGLQKLLFEAPAETVLRTLSGAPSWRDVIRSYREEHW